MIEQLVAQGVNPAELVPIVRRPKLLVLDGEGDDQESVEDAPIERFPNVRLKRYFTDRPIVSDGQTYVLSNQWGRQAEPTLEALVQAYPEARLSVHPA